MAESSGLPAANGSVGPGPDSPADGPAASGPRTRPRGGPERIETDYLVVGAGAAGMAFADSLVANSDAEVVLVDRRYRPGGHWNDAYPFVRLHQPSAYYGVNSRVLGGDAIDRQGPNAGFYERATAAEICAYFERVLTEDLLPTGRVRFFGKCDYGGSSSGEHRFVSLLTGAETVVAVRRKVVDARYLETAVPATHTPTFDVAAGVAVRTVNDLVDLTDPPRRYVILGGGKTGMDACVWLVENGVDPDRIRWIRPRDSWLLDRSGWQPLDRVVSIVEGFSLDMQAAAEAESVDDLFRRLEEYGRLVRIDETVVPTMYRCATVSREELESLRRIRDVVRLGRVRRIEPDRLVLEHGSVPAAPDDLYVDCTAIGLRGAPVRPVFERDRITIQQVRSCSPTFNAALIGYVEATRDEPGEQNRLCPASAYPDAATDWIGNFAASVTAAATWSAEPDLREWLEGSRLNLLRGARAGSDEPAMSRAFERYQAHFGAAIGRLRVLAAGTAISRPAMGR